MDKLAYSIREAVETTGIGRSRFYEAVKEQKVRTVKFGHRTLVLAEDLRTFLKSLPESRRVA